MHTILGGRRNGLRLTGIVLAGCVSACGGSTLDSGIGTGDASTGGDAVSSPVTNDAGVPTAPSCPTHTGLHPYDSAASGTITGDGVSGAFCNAAADVFLSESSISRGQPVFQLSANEALNSNFLLGSPKQASHGQLVGSISGFATRPGVYKSTDAEACGSMDFSYELPVPPEVNCEGKTGPNCPAGCVSACSGFGCEPCTAQPPELDYSAQGANDCNGDTQAVKGSWTLTLTSVAPYKGPTNGLDSYTVHGTFVSALVGSDGIPTTLTATF